MRWLDEIREWVRVVALILCVILILVMLILAVLIIMRIFGLWPAEWILWELQAKMLLGL